MTRVSVKRPLDFEIEQHLLEKLFTAISSLRNWQEAEAFFLEFLTKEELAMLAKRLDLYKRIQRSEPSRKIIQELGVTGQTVATARKKLRRADVYFERVLRKLQALDRDSS